MATVEFNFDFNTVKSFSTAGSSLL